MGVFKVEIIQFEEVTDRTILESMEEAEQFVSAFKERAEDPHFISSITDETEAAVMRAVRLERNLRLDETDWTQILDAPISESMSLKYREYRQALRDLPKKVDVNNVVWPPLPKEDK